MFDERLVHIWILGLCYSYHDSLVFFDDTGTGESMKHWKISSYGLMNFDYARLP
jgi:hypothetical protein